MEFSPVFKEITTTVRNHKFSVMYYGEHLRKRVFISIHGSLCLLIVLKEDSLELEFIKSITVKDDLIFYGISIVSKNEVILMLDKNGNLWQLINAFEQTEKLCMLDKECFYQWSPFNAFKLDKVYAITASCFGFVCIGALKNKMKKILLLSSSTLESFTFEDLNLTQSKSYYISCINVNVQKAVFKNELQSGNELFVVSDITSGKIYVCTKNRKNTIISIYRNLLVSVVSFAETKCFMLCFQNGKLLFNLYDNSLNVFSFCAEFLSKTITFIEKCFCCSSGFIWADSIDLYHTNIQFQLGKSHFTKLTHLKLNSKIQGMISCLKTDKGFLGVTVNNIYYFFHINSLPENQPLAHQFVTDISEAGANIENLNNEIKKCVEFLESKEMIQNKNLGEGFEFSVEGKHIILKNNICKTFNKNFWKVRQLVKVNNKHFVSITDLEIDWSYGMDLKIKRINEGNHDWLDVSLVGNIDSDFQLLLLCVQKLKEKKEDVKNENLIKNLLEIVKKKESLHSNAIASSSKTDTEKP